MVGSTGPLSRPAGIVLPQTNYSGPGDIHTFSHWWGLRAASRAKAGSAQKLVNVLDVTHGTNTYDLLSKLNGEINLGPLAGIEGHTFSINTVYDQFGSNNMTPFDGAVAFILVPLGTGFASYIDFTGFGTNDYLTATLSGSQGAPFTWSMTTGNNNAFDFGLASDGAGNNRVWIESGVRASSDANSTRMVNDNVDPTSGAKIRLNVYVDIAAGGGTICVNGANEDVGSGLSTLNGTGTTINWGFCVGIGDSAMASHELGIGGGGSAAINLALDANQSLYWGI